MTTRERFENRYFSPQGILAAIRISLQREHSGTALSLICAAIESMAFLNLPVDRHEMTDYDFVRWSNVYLRPEKMGIGGDELWAVRCALIDKYCSRDTVHTPGGRRQVLFAWDKYCISDGLKLPQSSRWHHIMSIHADELYKALVKGIEDFAGDFIGRPENSYIVSYRLNRIFGGGSA